MDKDILFLLTPFFKIEKELGSPLHKSGGRVLTGKTKRRANRAAAAFRLAASCVAKSKTALGAFTDASRRAGASKAIIATARKLAVVYYTML